MSQTSYASSFTLGRNGQIADLSCSVRDSFAAEGALTFGNVVQLGTADGQIKAIAALPATDADSIATLLATTTGNQTFSGADLDGVTGAKEIVPAQLITLTLNAVSSWDATTAVLYGLDAAGRVIQENIAIPNDGGVTVTSTLCFSRITSIYLPAQSGTSGTMDVGTIATRYELSKRSFPGVAVYQPMSVSYSAAAEVATQSEVAVVVKGRVYVTVEAAVVPGDPVWVRMVESGSDLRGQVRGSYIANFGLLHGAKFISTAAIDGIAVLEIG